MNANLLGAVFVLTGCAGMGFSVARNYQHKIDMLRSFLQLLGNMVTEISCKITPLPELCRTAAASNSCFRRVMILFADSMDRQIEPSPSACMKAVLVQYLSPCVEFKQCLFDLADILGNYDLTGQIRQLESLHEKWSRILKALEADLAIRLRYFRVLGICAGAALAIILV